MYYLNDRVSPTGFVASQPDPVHLSHPSVQKLRCVVYIESFIFSLGCESCELGKYHYATYQSQVNNHNSSAFELVHSDRS